MSDDITVTVILSTGDAPGSGVIVGINHAAGEELGDITMNPDVNGDSLRAAIAGMTFISQGARERLAGRFEDGMGGLEFDDRMCVVATDRQVDRLAASLYMQNMQLIAHEHGERPPQLSVEQAWEIPPEDVKDSVREVARAMLDRVREVEL